MKINIGKYKMNVELKDITSGSTHYYDNDFHVQNDTKIGNLPISVELENLEFELSTEEFCKAGKGISEVITTLSTALKDIFSSSVSINSTSKE